MANAMETCFTLSPPKLNDNKLHHSKLHRIPPQRPMSPITWPIAKHTSVKHNASAIDSHQDRRALLDAYSPSLSQSLMQSWSPLNPRLAYGPGRQWRPPELSSGVNQKSRYDNALAV